jgi:hypothetical protein
MCELALSSPSKGGPRRTQLDVCRILEVARSKVTGPFLPHMEACRPERSASSMIERLRSPAMTRVLPKQHTSLAVDQLRLSCSFHGDPITLIRKRCAGLDISKGIQ